MTSQQDINKLRQNPWAQCMLCALRVFTWKNVRDFRERWTRWSHKLTSMNPCKYNFPLNLWMPMSQKFNFYWYFISFFHIELIKMFRMLGEYVWTGFMHRILGMIIFFMSESLGINNDHALNPVNKPLIQFEFSTTFLTLGEWPNDWSQWILYHWLNQSERVL